MPGLELASKALQVANRYTSFGSYRPRISGQSGICFETRFPPGGNRTIFIFSADLLFVFFWGGGGQSVLWYFRVAAADNRGVTGRGPLWKRHQSA